IIAGNFSRPAGVCRIVAVDAIDAGKRFRLGRERQQPFAVREMRRPARVLHQGGTTGGEITLSAIAEPPGSRGDIGVLGDSKFRLGLLNEAAIVVEAARY